jgi:hypothetical protein
MSRDPWIGTPYYGWADEGDDDYADKKAQKEAERLKRWQKKWEEDRALEAKRMQARTEALLAYEPFKAAARARVTKEHPVLVGGSLVATALAKLFDGALF